MTIEAVLHRIKRVASIIEADAKSPWNRERARELANLVAIAERELERDKRADRAGGF